MTMVDKSIIKNFCNICIVVSFFVFVVFTGNGFADLSDLFPAIEPAPPITSYVKDGHFQQEFYIASDGDDLNGDGSFGNPWASLSGATINCSSDICPESKVGAGDVIYFRGGDYFAEFKVDGRIAASHFNIRDRGTSFGITNMHGTPDNYIVIAAYPGEVPIFKNADHGSLKGYPSFSIHANYVVIDGLTFEHAGFFIRNASNNIIQNCTFGEGEFIFGDQVSRTSFGLTRMCDNTTVRNNIFNTSDGHSIKAYTSEGSNSNTIIKYNTFKNNTCGYGVINQKIYQIDWVINNNRFENCHRAISIGGDYGNGPHHGLKIYNNAFDNCDIVIDYINYTSEISGVMFYQNIVLNGDTSVLYYRCDGVCTSSDSGLRFGEFYDNAFYNISDLINPRSTTNFVNYPNFWDFNAVASNNIQSTAENVNNESNNWGGGTIIQPAHGITHVEIAAGEGFYQINDASAFIGRGRTNGNIGGFVFGAQQDKPNFPQEFQSNN